MPKIALAGYDVEGQASYRYFRRDGANEIVIFDEAETPRGEIPAGVEAVSGPRALDELRRRSFDVVVRTPSLSPQKLQGIAGVTSATREFFARCPAPTIIGVTGTKGKGTTCSLIASILREAGKTVHLVGNIGLPALDALPDITTDDIVVYELSSFQLWDLDVSPHIAVLLMIEPDHLDVHRDFVDYVDAKARITAYQMDDDILVYNNLDNTATQIAIQSDAQKVPYPHEQFAHVRDGHFWYNEHKLCSTSPLKLPGKHNLENACAAISAVWPYVQDGEVIARGLGAFDGLPHRLKFVNDVNGTQYYDDSIATTPGSAIAAIKAFEGPKILILGGSDKGADFAELYAAIAAGNVKHVVLIGTLAGVLEKGLSEHGYPAVTNLGFAAMPQIVQTAHDLAMPGDTVIMSPACASLDMFKNYKDRGEQFVAAVETLKGEV